MSLSEFHQEYDKRKFQITDYTWMWKLLKFRARQHGWFPRRLHAVLKKFGNPNKPYFIGETGEGTKFLGDYRDEYSATCQVCQEYDTLLTRFICGAVGNRKGNYLDIGSNMGVTAATIARFLGDRGEVLAFEPVKETAQRAAATFALNNLTNVRLFQCAVGDQNGDITFYAAPGNSEWASANKTEQEMAIHWTETKVVCHSLDSLMDDKQLGDVLLVKVDVEGHEPKVVEGACRFLGESRPDFIFEYNSSVATHLGWKPSTIEALLKKIATYRCQVLHSDNRLADFPFPDEMKGVFNIYASCQSRI